MSPNSSGSQSLNLSCHIYIYIYQYIYCRLLVAYRLLPIAHICIYARVATILEATSARLHKRAGCLWRPIQCAYGCCASCIKCKHIPLSIYRERYYIYIYIYGCVYFVSVKAKQRTVLLKYTSLTSLYFTLWAQNHTLARGLGPAAFGPWARVPGPYPLWLSIWPPRAVDRQ